MQGDKFFKTMLGIILFGAIGTFLAAQLVSKPQNVQAKPVDMAAEEVYNCVESEIRSLKDWHDPKISRESVFTCAGEDALRAANWACIRDREDDKHVKYTLDFNARCPDPK